jgi:uncharacterized membrane protein SpoIIM required for sporulation
MASHGQDRKSKGVTNIILICYHCSLKMRESKFVEQNKEKWAQFEKDLKSKKKDPHLLRAQLVQITDDLSYSRTYYRNRSVRIYLNGLGQQVYNNIYKNKKNFFKSLGTFFREDIPKIVFHSRKEMLISFLVLVLAVAIGIFSSAKDEQFARSILGDAYVEQTLENINKGDPMGIYKHMGRVEMFFAIAMNNLLVSLVVFIFGLIASYGALVMMVRNGIMLGVFMYFFYSRNLSTEFNFTVWMHGTIEILTLVVETVAGMLLGRGLVYPGTLTRIKAFSIWGKRGAMLFLSTVPFIIFAAFIESFLTRHTEMPNAIRGLLIFLSLGLMVFYFVLYPYYKFRHTNDIDLGMPDLKPETSVEFRKDTIYSNGNIFLKSIQLFSLKFSSVLKFTVLLSIGYLGVLALFYLKNSIMAFRLLDIEFGEFILRLLTNRLDKFMKMYANVSILFNHLEDIIMYCLSSLWMALIAFFSLKLVGNQMGNVILKPVKIIFMSLLFSFALNLVMLVDNGWMVVLYIFVSPLAIVLLSNAAFGINGKDIFSSISEYMASGLSRMTGVLFMFLMITFFGMIFIISPMSYVAIWVMEMNVELSDKTYNLVLQCIMMFAFIGLMTFSMVFYITQCIYLSFSIHEIAEAKGLLDGIEKIGETKRAYGIETE